MNKIKQVLNDLLLLAVFTILLVAICVSIIAVCFFCLHLTQMTVEYLTNSGTQPVFPPFVHEPPL